jgi:hypothetical protein
MLRARLSHSEALTKEQKHMKSIRRKEKSDKIKASAERAP